MAFDARQIANWFIERASRDGRTLSIMQLLKLVYIAHGWHLGTKGKPLISNRIEAWQYGPVIPELYHASKRNSGASSIHVGTEFEGFPAPETPDVAGFLEEIYDIYGNMSPFGLSDLTHVEGGPWEVATRLNGYYARIPDELIEHHYQEKRQKAMKADHG